MHAVVPQNSNLAAVRPYALPIHCMHTEGEVWAQGCYAVQMATAHPPEKHLGAIVRHLVASKMRRDGAQASKQLQALLYRPTDAKSLDTSSPGLFRSFVLVHDQAAKLETAGVVHASIALQVAAEAPLSSMSVPLQAVLTLEASHLASKARQLGVLDKAARSFAKDLMRTLSIACKDALVSHRRPVSLQVKLVRGIGCPGYIARAMHKGLIAERWRLSNWGALARDWTFEDLAKPRKRTKASPSATQIDSRLELIS
jgi:hypothetical protein